MIRFKIVVSLSVFGMDEERHSLEVWYIDVLRQLISSRNINYPRQGGYDFIGVSLLVSRITQFSSSSVEYGT